MNALDIKKIADEANQIDHDKLDADYDHIEIEIYESAKNGHYSVEYHFLESSKNFGEVNEFRNRLVASGFEVEINEDEGEYSLVIDWSKEEY